jgi:hypothetical protein
MSIGASPAPLVGDQSVVAAVEVDVRGRWDALALSELLAPFHSFLVRQAADRWVVHARAPGCHGETLADAFRAIEKWRTERCLDAPDRVDGHSREAS